MNSEYRSENLEKRECRSVAPSVTTHLSKAKSNVEVISNSKLSIHKSKFRPKVAYKPYAEYENSGVEWLGEIPSHWDISKLRYWFTFGKGLTITKADLRDTGVPCVNYGEVHSKCGFEVDPTINPLKHVSEQYLQSSPNALLSKGDFVFADTSEDIEGSGNFTQLVSNQAVFAGYHTVIVRPKEGNDARFLAYALDSIEYRTQIRVAVKGVKVFSITQAILRNANIWFPTFPEQRTIAAFLDHETGKIDELICKQQDLIALLEEKRQAVISHTVTKGLDPNVPMKDSGVEWLGEVPEGWEVTCLKYKSTRIGDGLHSTPVYDDEGDFYFINGNNLIEGKISINNMTRSVSRKEYDKHRVEMNCNTILLSINGTIGNLAFYDNEPVMLGKSAAYINCTEDVCKEFCYFVLMSNPTKRFFALEMTGTTISNLSLNSINNTPFPFPPYEEQVSISKYLTAKLGKFEILIDKAKSAIELMQERHTALISAAVTGKIDVRGWTQSGRREISVDE